MGIRHRPGDTKLQTGRILEIAFGTFNESDIERLHDDYARPENDRG